MIELEILNEQNIEEAKGINRLDIPGAFVDTVDTIYANTCYGIEHHCIGYTFVIRYNHKVVGILLLGEALHWTTDPPIMDQEPFYRLMGFIIDANYRSLGIGSQALELAINKVYQDFGRRSIVLGVHQDNILAAKFYQRHGFTPTPYYEGKDQYYIRLLDN